MATATTTRIPPAPTWDLDAIFPGGSASEEFRRFRQRVKSELDTARRMLDELPAQLSDASVDAWRRLILAMQSLEENVHLVASFAHCLVVQDVSDTAAQAIEAEADVYQSDVERLRTAFEAMAKRQPDDAWEKLLSHPDLQPIRFYLDELRENARLKMPEQLESLALELAVNGYHAWNRLYDKMAGELRVDFEENGRVETLSLGQLATRMSNPDREVRRRAFEKLTEAWQSRADLAAIALNAQAGFRLTLYRRRGWDSPLFEPLRMARLKRESLEAMWRVVAAEKHRLKPYIEAKCRLLGLDANRWYDQFAPVGSSERLWPFDEAGEFIVKHTAAFSDDLAQFCRMALEKRWVEAEDRPGKAGGGFCTGMGPFRQSRIFMTYSGTYDNLLTLAHELGHAYHSYVLRHTPWWATRYTMTTAETASTFTELLVTDAALSAADTKDERLMLLDQKLQAAYTMFCDLHSRYLFDCAFYAEREKGMVETRRLNELMIGAQKEAFGDLLDPSGYHPLFWCSKLHFFITDVPFYNYPYVVGYLFAGGVYDRARKEGKSFAEKYRAMLADTGSMTTEEIARKHLDADLTSEAFWKTAVDRALADVDAFVELAAP